MDMVRKRKDTVELNGEILMKEMLVARSPQEILETEELKFAIEDAVNRLNPSERRLYELRQVEGRELDEIADETKIPKPSVKSIISAARRKIYEELKKSLRS